MGGDSQKLIDNILRQKADIARCDSFYEETTASVVFRATLVCRIKEDIRIDDEGHKSLFHDCFQRISIRQVDIGSAHAKSRQVKVSDDLTRCSSSQSFSDKFTDKISHGTSLGSGKVFQT